MPAAEAGIGAADSLPAVHTYQAGGRCPDKYAGSAAADVSGRFSAPVRPADNIPAAVILWHGK